jgi:hypothetical protein
MHVPDDEDLAEGDLEDSATPADGFGDGSELPGGAWPRDRRDHHRSRSPHAWRADPRTGGIMKYRKIITAVVLAGTSGFGAFAGFAGDTPTRVAGVALFALTWIGAAALTTPRDWGIQVEGPAVTWCWRVMEQAASAGDPGGVLMPMGDGRWYFPAAARRDAERMRRVMICMAGVDPALVTVISGAQALRRGLRPDKAVRAR